MHTHHLDGHKEVKNRFVSDFAAGTNLLLSKKQGNFMNRPGSRNRKNKKKIRGALAGAGIVALVSGADDFFWKDSPGKSHGQEPCGCITDVSAFLYAGYGHGSVGEISEMQILMQVIPPIRQNRKNSNRKKRNRNKIRILLSRSSNRIRIHRIRIRI